MRARGETMPVIILTARDGVDDTVAGLEGGADDYVTKPFRFEELLARIRLRLRDGVATGVDGAAAPAASPSTCARGGVVATGRRPRSSS